MRKIISRLAVLAGFLLAFSGCHLIRKSQAASEGSPSPEGIHKNAKRQDLIKQNEALSGKNQAIKGAVQSALIHQKNREGYRLITEFGAVALLSYVAYIFLVLFPVVFLW